jgi:hypothetical protein
MPADDVALELLTLTGPLAVSSANRTGQAPAQTAAAAREQLADSVEVYLEGGPRPLEGGPGVPSTIVDATGPVLRVVRDGAVSLDQLREHVPGVLGLGEDPSPAGDAGAAPAGDAQDGGDVPASEAGSSAVTAPDTESTAAAGDQQP